MGKGEMKTIFLNHCEKKTLMYGEMMKEFCSVAGQRNKYTQTHANMHLFWLLFLSIN